MLAVYKITNLVNGKFYVGSSVDVRLRFKNHRYDLRKKRHHCQPLQRAWDKYGEDSFKFEVIEEASSSGEIHAIENRWLEEHYRKGSCYNIGTRAGAAFLGRAHTGEARMKVSKAQKGKQHRLGHTNSPEHRARISAANKGKQLSPEHAEKIRQRMLGTSYAKGRVVTEEERARRGRAVVEITSGLEFISTPAAAAHFGLQRANVRRALRGDAPLKRGPKAGLHFRYLEKHTLPSAPE